MQEIKSSNSTYFLLKNKKIFRKVTTFAKDSNLACIITHLQKKCNSFSEISKNSAKIYERIDKKQSENIQNQSEMTNF